MFFDDRELIELLAIPPLTLLLAFLLVGLAFPPRAEAVPASPAPPTGRPQVVLALSAGGHR